VPSCFSRAHLYRARYRSSDVETVSQAELDLIVIILMNLVAATWADRWFSVLVANMANHARPLHNLASRLSAVLLVLLLWLQFCTPGIAHAAEKWAVSRFPDNVHVMDLEGRKINPFASPLSKAVVFIFASVECPISNGYMPEYGRLADEFNVKGVAFTLVFPNADESAEDIRKHLAAYKCSITAVRDPGHELVKVSEVSCTPEAAVFAAERGLIYHGRIDDRHVELGRTRPEATRHDLRKAIEAALDGKLPEARATRAVGCHIAGLP
jgi:hypothetical protein